MNAYAAIALYFGLVGLSLFALTNGLAAATPTPA